MLRHPWAPGLLGSRRSIPVGVLRHYEAILGFSSMPGSPTSSRTGRCMPSGACRWASCRRVFDPADEGASGQAGDDELAAMAQDLPHLTAMVAAEIHDAADPQLGWCDSQTGFEFTVDLLLDGLERLRADQAQRPRSRGRGARGRALNG